MTGSMISKGGRRGIARSSVPGTVVVWDSVSTEATAMVAAAAELAAETVLLLRGATVGEGDILALDNGLLRVGGQRRNGVCGLLHPIV